MIQDLINATIENKDDFAYINLDSENKYRGWVTDLRLTHVPTNERLFLDLHNERDLFILFVMALAWSRTGQWENAAFFAAYVKTTQFDIIKNGVPFVKASSVVKNFVGITPRKAVSFRKDIFPSVDILCTNWTGIKQKMKEAGATGNWKKFAEYMREIPGLAGRMEKKGVIIYKNMMIKIPLILRELRCQNIYPNIPGELCCVIDDRVKTFYCELNKKFPNKYKTECETVCKESFNKIEEILAASSVLYDHFHDLYDIPTFAYEDLAPKYGWPLPPTKEKGKKKK